MLLIETIYGRSYVVVDCANELFNAARLCPGSHSMQIFMPIADHSMELVNLLYPNRMSLRSIQVCHLSRTTDRRDDVVVSPRSLYIVRL